MPTGRDAIDLKFDRALAHAEHLTVELDSMDVADFWSLNKAVERGSEDIVWTIGLKKQPPEMWSLYLGDAVHNARTALDILAWRLVESDGGEPGRATQFPIVEQPGGFTQVLKRSLAGTTQETRDNVRNIKPWKGGAQAIYDLHKLDIQDKHQMLVPVVASHWGLQINLTGLSDPTDHVDDIIFQVTIPNGVGPIILKDGDEVHRVTRAAHRSAEAANLSSAGWIHVEDGPAVFFAFGEDAGVTARLIAPGLRDLIETVRQEVEPLVVRVA